MYQMSSFRIKLIVCLYLLKLELLTYQDTNWARKREHTEAGNMLHKLEGEWLELVGKNYAVERACAELETEVEKLESLKKQKLSEQTEQVEQTETAS